MILRFLTLPLAFHAVHEGRGPFRGFGHGRGHGHGHDHAHDTEREHGDWNFKAFAGFGPFGGGRGRRGGFGLGRKIGSGDLQAVLLSLLAEKPSYGYELIKALEERSGGFYVPSPGMVYPALTYLEELGHATVETEGARKRYSITEDGKAHLANNRASVEAIMAEFARIGSRMDDVRRAMAGVEDDSSDDQGEMHRARHALRAALFSKRRSSPIERKRIAAILERAASEILAPS